MKDSLTIDPLYNAEDIMKVMRVIRELKATYPSEISMRTRLPKDYVYAIVEYLIAEEYIERISMLDSDNMDDRMAFRKVEMFSKGIQGYNRWRMFNWVGFRDWKLYYELESVKQQKLSSDAKNLVSYEKV